MSGAIRGVVWFLKYHVPATLGRALRDGSRQRERRGVCGIIGRMRIVLQRVSQGSVDVVNELGTIDPTFEPQQIGPGFVALVGVSDDDGDEQIAWLAHKVLCLRVFEDEQGKMNRSIQDVGGEILSISQFTLYADVRKGNRPSFVGAGAPEHADLMWIKFNEALRSGGVPVREGRFGAHMRVGLVNDGPVTIVIDTDTAMKRAG